MVDVRWERCWPDRPNDYQALDTENGGYVGRIYVHGQGGNAGRWVWFSGSSSGFCDSKQEADDAVRARWKEVCAARPAAQDELWPERLRKP